MKPNYIDCGWSGNIGKNLRKEIERQLLIDLKIYRIDNENLKFDWSKSTCEGDDAYYLDGYVDIYSGIKLFNINCELIIDGWMDYIYEEYDNLFIVYWDLLDFYNQGKKIRLKEFGLPNHICKKLPVSMQEKFYQSL